ncbi:MAG: hypothetical protein HN929_10240, partial [Chloroflexi bacterium]|nr:hypothetical protein [Chloroflexota bacterium]
KLDSSVQGIGGFAARAKDGVEVNEVAGDLLLVKPENWEDPLASVWAPEGPVVLSTVNGSIRDAALENSDSEDNVEVELDDSMKEAGYSEDRVQYAVSPGLMEYLYPHKGKITSGGGGGYGTELANVIATDLTLTALGASSQIGTVSDTMTIDNPENFDALSTEQKQILSDAGVGDIIGVSYELYEYLGPNDTLDLTHIEVIPGQTLVRNLHSADVGVYRYTGTTATRLILGEVQYASDPNWTLTDIKEASFGENPAGHKYFSTYQNSEQFSDSGRWRKLDPQFITGVSKEEAQEVNISSQNLVRVQYSGNYGLYRYLGADAALDFSQQDFSDDDIWQKIEANAATGNRTGTENLAGTINLQTGDIVSNRFAIESLTLKVWDDLDIESTGILNARADNIAMQSAGSLTIKSIVADGDIRVISGGDILLNAGSEVLTRAVDSDIYIDASGILHVKADSAITAGAQFDYSSGIPVAQISGENSDIYLRAGKDMWIGGSVTASRNMDFVMGDSTNEFADYFDTIPAKTLFATPGDMTAEDLSTIAGELDSGNVSDQVRELFTANRLELAETPELQQIEAGKRWELNSGEDKYILYMSDPEDDGVLNELKVQEPHYLLGHRGFGFLLTGTLTTLMQDADIWIQGKDDLIIRGRIDQKNEASDLTLESDKWVYWEGFADIGGDIGIYGGMDKSGLEIIDRQGANAQGDSVYIHATSELVTHYEGTEIIVYGSKDIKLNGAMVAGGTIGEDGVTFAGPDSKIIVNAGEQAFVDTTLIAQKEVTVKGGISDNYEGGTGVILTTGAGLVARGETSDDSGGLVSVFSGGDMQLMGSMLSGGRSQNDEITWIDENSIIKVEAQGQAWIGGQTRAKDGELIEIGGRVFASKGIEIIGGSHDEDGLGVRMPGSAYVASSNPDSYISIKSAQDAKVSAVMVAGGEIITHKDQAGYSLGETVSTFDGDSKISIEAGHQIRLGRDLYAGKEITLRGGDDPKDGTSGSIWEGKGLVLYDSSHLQTWRPNSEINISAAGDIAILASAWEQEIEAAGFPETAFGKLSEDVSFKMEIDLGTCTVQGLISLNSSETANNLQTGDLQSDLQEAIKSAEFIVTQSDTGDPAVDSVKELEEAPVNVRMIDGRLLLSSNYAFTLLTEEAQHADLLGFAQLAEANAASIQGPAIDASEKGSLVNIGSATQ